ncbi:Ascorbate-specific PTS system EIIA component [bioreactor metagenome]|uniref:Ascorbate-specific PTS system EIIA component n=1 Tax=bioreactor metagenome TaxID=1076179 RepID=A0A645GWR6_9ZZZZ
MIDERYIAAVIKCVEDYGPYIVMMPNVAIPHSTDHAVGVNQPAIALMIVKQPVIFAEDDRDKDARLFFMVASKDSASHLKAIQDLCEVLDNEPLMEKLMTCNNEQELKALVDSL